MLATISAIVPVLLIEKYVLTHQSIYMICALLSYAILAYSYIKLFRVDEITVIYPILQIIQLIIVVIASVYLFRESLHSDKIIGLVLGGISIYFLSKKN